MQRLIRGAIVAAVSAASFVLPVLAAPAQQDNQAIITSPTDGQAVAGLAPIFGTATSNDFARYEIAYGSDPNPNDAWQPFATAEVILRDAQLGVWDTTNLPAGTYMIRLRVIRPDGNFAEDIVRGLIVGPAATATPQATPTDVPPPPTFETETQATIQPTIVIEQPPTSTPEPVVAGGSTDDSAAARRDGNSGLDLSRFSSACINGVWCSVGVFFLLGALGIGRWGMRRLLKQMQERENQ
ncbi:MAG TPA: hypothetical protein VJG32_22600 [Anaerolineae bacterium]|nr:hypothetical protein [Anaerolineae bacterium]